MRSLIALAATLSTSRKTTFSYISSPSRHILLVIGALASHNLCPYLLKSANMSLHSINHVIKKTSLVLKGRLDFRLKWPSLRNVPVLLSKKLQLTIRVEILCMEVSLTQSFALKMKIFTFKETLLHLISHLNSRSNSKGAIQVMILPIANLQMRLTHGYTKWSSTYKSTMSKFT